MGAPRTSAVKRLHPLRDAFEVHVFAAARPPREAEAHEVDQQHGEHGNQ